RVTSGERVPKRTSVRVAVGVLFGVVVSCAAATGTQQLFAPTSTVHAAGTLTFTPFLTGLPDPVFGAQPPDGSNRFAVVLRQGFIRIAVNGVLQPTPFLDVSSLVVATSNSEQGLLGLAFHPEYATNGYFFIYYTGTDGTNTLARYRV